MRVPNVMQHAADLYPTLPLFAPPPPPEITARTNKWPAVSTCHPALPCPSSLCGKVKRSQTYLLSSESNLALSTAALMHSRSGSCTTNSSTKLSGMLNSCRREWYLQAGRSRWKERACVRECNCDQNQI